MADDSATMQKVVDLVLREQGYEVVTANNGQEAMNLVAATPPPALVLAFIKLPGMDGYEICRNIKSNPATKGIPVILLAGAFDPVDESRKAEVGAEDSLIKPFQAEDLLKKIQARIGAAAPAAAAPASAGDDIVFGGEDDSMSFAGVAEAGETVMMAPAVEAEPVMAEAVEEEALMAEVADAEETVMMAPAVEAEPVMAEAVEEEPLMAEAVEEEPLMAEAVEAEPVMAEAVVEETVMKAAPAAAAPAAGVSMASVDSASMEAVIRETVGAKVTEALAAIDLRDVILKALEPHAAKALEKIAYDAVPEFLDRTLRGTIMESLGAVNRELENIIWETVPQLADTMLKKEMERIRQESQ